MRVGMMFLVQAAASKKSAKTSLKKLNLEKRHHPDFKPPPNLPHRVPYRHDARQRGRNWADATIDGRNYPVEFVLDKEILVKTAAPENFKSLLKQRARWGRKSFGYPSFFAKLLAVFIAVFAVFQVMVLVFAIANPLLFPFAVFMFLVKFLSDFSFLKKYAKATGEENLLKDFWVMELVYPVYILVVVSVVLVGKTGWKD